MEVGHGFAAVTAVVDDEAVAVGETSLLGDLGGFEEEVAEELLVGGGGGGDAWNGLFGDDQDMGRSLGGDVVESSDEVVLVNNLGRDFAGDDFFEDGLAHGWKVARGPGAQTTTRAQPEPVGRLVRQVRR